MLMEFTLIDLNVLKGRLKILHQRKQISLWFDAVAKVDQEQVAEAM